MGKMKELDQDIVEETNMEHADTPVAAGDENGVERGEGIEIIAVIDMQHDFVDGALANPDAQAIVSGIVDEVRRARERGALVVWTKDTHSESTYMSSQEGEKLPVPHCLVGTKGHDIVDELEAVRADEDDVIEKPVFGSIDLAERIAARVDAAGYDENDATVVFMGTCTDICVVSNALILKAKMPEAKVKVVADLCAGLSPEKHEHALDVMESCQVEVI